MTPKIWKQVSVSVPLEAEEAVADFLIQASGRGVHLNDSDDTVRINAFLPPEESGRKIQAIKRYIDQLAGMEVVPSETAVIVEEIEEEDWMAVFRSQHTRVRITDSLTVRPTWCPSGPGREIVLDPGMAFGTGSHATTQQCLVLLNMTAGPSTPDRMLDLGTGTGILAIAGAFLAIKDILALDVDPVAVSTAEKNVAANNVAGQVKVRLGGMEKAEGKFDIIAANLSGSQLVHMNGPLSAALAPKGRLIISGITLDEERGVLEAFSNSGLRPTEVLHEGEWLSALLLPRSNDAG